MVMGAFEENTADIIMGIFEEDTANIIMGTLKENTENMIMGSLKVLKKIQHILLWDLLKENTAHIIIEN